MRVVSSVGYPLLNPLPLAGEEENEKGAGSDQLVLIRDKRAGLWYFRALHVLVTGYLA